jgi:P27 family predicted phage terminase small subunit
MPAGRPPKPTAIKELEGNPGKRRLNKAEPVVAKKLALTPPKHLSKGAKAIWITLASNMPYGVLTTVDEAVFASFCETEATRQGLQAAMDKQPLMTTGSTGQLVVNPILKQINDQARLLVTLSAKLGFDPVSRRMLTVPTGDDDGEHDDFGIGKLAH